MLPHKALIQQLKQQYRITHPKVLKAITEVPREQFVPLMLKKRSYDNTALPIECEQTISQPYIVALMTQALFEHPHPQKILEVGTGSGYQAAILGKIFKSVWTIERIETLYLKAKKTLENLGYKNIHTKCGNGSLGWPEAAPFDGILVTAAAKHIPAALLEQLDPLGGLMVIPLGTTHRVQRLTLIKRHEEKFEQSTLELVCFVPLIEEDGPQA